METQNGWNEHDSKSFCNSQRSEFNKWIGLWLTRTSFSKILLFYFSE
jgi:hypothetical protein